MSNIFQLADPIWMCSESCLARVNALLHVWAALVLSVYERVHNLRTDV
jgi:hypothetical protein